MTTPLSAGVTTLLCDADGNLFPSEEPAFVASAAVTNDFLAAIGVPARFTAEQLRIATTGQNFRTTATGLAVAHGVPVGRDVAGHRSGAHLGEEPVLTSESLQRWVDEERQRVSAHLEQVLQPDEAVHGPLSRLGSRYTLAAVSSSALGRLTACFGAAGLTAFFPQERVFSAEDSLPVPTSKPDPAIYLHACERLGIAPAAALAVEDSVPGALSALRAGIRTIGNVQFVPEPERAERRRLLLAAGVEDVVFSWTQIEERLSNPA